MRAVNHTPGPWRECGAERGGCICRQVWSVKDDVLVAIAVEKDEFHPIPPEMSQANARLIAAAPELLAACKAALKHAEKSGDAGCTCELCEQLRSAITKAEGRG